MQPVTEVKFGFESLSHFPLQLGFKIPSNLYTFLLHYLEKVNTSVQS